MTVTHKNLKLYKVDLEGLKKGEKLRWKARVKWGEWEVSQGKTQHEWDQQAP